jgi:hypothetical protein
MITGVDIDKDNNIYVADSKEGLIRKYTKDGKFIKEVGRCGHGPEDFGKHSLVPIVYKSNLYVYDYSNRKINVYNNLNYIKTIRIKYKTFFRNFFIINSLFYGPIFISENNKRIYVYDRKGELKFSFFDKYPDYINIKNKNRFYVGVASMYSYLLMDYNKKRDNFVITFFSPGKQMILYYYNHKGKFIKKQSFTLLKAYKFPKHLLSYPPKNSVKFKNIQVDSVFYYKDRYVLVNYKIDEIYKMKTINTEAFIIVIDFIKGKIVVKKNVSAGLRILKIKGEYLYAKNFEDDIEKLHIYKIERIK